MDQTPHLVCSDARGRIVDLPGYEMAGLSGRTTVRVDPHELIELPPGSQLYLMPGRRAVGFNRASGRMAVIDDAYAVAAFIPPSYTQTYLAPYVKTPEAPLLPLYSYTAVGWFDGKYYVSAVRVDEAVKQLPTSFQRSEVEAKVRQKIRDFPYNRLITHHGEKCALEYGCPNAKNLFLGRWEAPVAVAAGCNANCLGCISYQPKDTTPSPQNRLDFVPTVSEIVELAVPHLDTAAEAIVSFGQGCEGEPLLHGDLIETAIREIRNQTSSGVLHLNTNGSRPDVLKKLFKAGLDSVRVSLNSMLPVLYHRYYRPNNYTFDDVMESLRVAVEMKKYTSINYFVFPGLTDGKDEVEALEKCLNETPLQLIQWRNFNIDPSWYIDEVAYDYDPQAIGVRSMMERIRARFPHVEFGYNNRARSQMKGWHANDPVH